MMGPIFAFLEISLGGEFEEILRRLFPSGDMMTRLGDMYGRNAAHRKASAFTSKKVVQAGDSRQRDGPAFTQM
jgi:hypothetical protein